MYSTPLTFSASQTLKSISFHKGHWQVSVWNHPSRCDETKSFSEGVRCLSCLCMTFNTNSVVAWFVNWNHSELPFLLTGSIRNIREICSLRSVTHGQQMTLGNKFLVSELLVQHFTCHINYPFTFKEIVSIGLLQLSLPCWQSTASVIEWCAHYLLDIPALRGIWRWSISLLISSGLCL